MKTLYYSVRLESLVRISDKAYKATAYDGSTAIIPASQVMGQDYEVSKSEAYWISAWILKRKNLQYSKNKSAWFKTKSKEDKRMVKEDVIIRKHNPIIIQPIDNNIINDLKRQDNEKD